MEKIKKVILFLLMILLFNIGVGYNVQAEENDTWRLDTAAENENLNYFSCHYINYDKDEKVYDQTELFSLRNMYTGQVMGAYCIDINTSALDRVYYENINLEEIENDIYGNFKNNEDKIRNIILNSFVPIKKIETACNIKNLRKEEVVRGTQFLLWKILHGAKEVNRTLPIYEKKLFEGSSFVYPQMVKVQFEHAFEFEINGKKMVYPLSAPLIDKNNIQLSKRWFYDNNGNVKYFLGLDGHNQSKVKRLHKESSERVYKVMNYLENLEIDESIQDEKGSLEIKEFTSENDKIKFKIIPKGNLSEIDVNVKIGDKKIKNYKLSPKQSKAFVIDLKKLSEKDLEEIEKIEDKQITVTADAIETVKRINALSGTSHTGVKSQTLIGVEPILTRMPIHAERNLKDIIINIYKLGGEKFDIDSPIDHDLTQISPDQYENLGKGVGPVEGIKFTYWKLTKEEYEKLISKGADTVEQVRAILGPNYKGKEIGPTDEDGLVTEKIPTDPNGNLFYYYFVESGGVGNVIGSMAVPFAINLPVRNISDILDDQGNILYPAGTKNLEEIYVYPKNIIDKNKPNPEKTVDDKEEATKFIGETATYNLMTTIPKNIFRKTKFVFYEKLDPALTYTTKPEGIRLFKKANAQKFKESGLEIPRENYDVKIEGQVLTVSIKKEYLQTLTNENGTNIFSVKFVAKVNSNVVIDQSIENQFTIKFDNGEGVDSEEESNITKVIVGGKKFKKVNLAHVGLSGAEFIIQDAMEGKEVKYLCESENGEFYWSPDKSKAKKFISTEKGEFEVKGLALTNKLSDKLTDLGEIQVTDEKVHNYQLVEIKAPPGYAVILKPIDFEIKLGEYTNKNNDENTILEILNKKLLIPQTGALGSIGIILTGIGISAIAVKKMREE